MKKTYTLTLAALLLAGSVHARTWTSAEGGKQFQGEYVSHTDDVVTVKKGFKTVRFKIALLSEDDSKWLAEQKAKAENENKPEYLLQAIESGFFVETDLWLINNLLYLGHDEPQYEINIDYHSLLFDTH